MGSSIKALNIQKKGIDSWAGAGDFLEVLEGLVGSLGLAVE